MLTDTKIKELLNTSSEKLSALSGGRNHSVFLYRERDERLCIKLFHSVKRKTSKK